MTQTSTYAPVAVAAIDRVQDIAIELADANLHEDTKQRLLEELDFHASTLRHAFSHRKKSGPSLGPADSDSYFNEKLVGMISFAKMAIDTKLRGEYTSSRIVDNVQHYSYLIADLVAVPWHSRSRRPASDRALKRSSAEHRDALKRLVDR